MEFLVVTGLSGAGKTQASHAFEDMGYYCIDNIPVNLLERFFELCSEAQNDRKYCAIIDIRAVLAFGDISRIKSRLSNLAIQPKILYLDASDDSIIRRYKETRRRHPLLDNDTIQNLNDAVSAERLALSGAKASADFVIDTTTLTPAALKEKLCDLFGEGASAEMRISVNSFGFKNGLPADVDLVFDVRCLPNPYYVRSLRDRRGTDSEVADYVFASEQSREFLERILSLLKFSLPLYQKEGKSSLVIAIGCTGGHHRSVAFAEAIGTELAKTYGAVTVLHRDIRR